MTRSFFALTTFLNPRSYETLSNPAGWPQKMHKPFFFFLKRAELSSWIADMNWGNGDDVLK